MATYRPMEFADLHVSRRDGADGVVYLEAAQPLAPYPARMTDRLLHWAQHRPHATWLAQRTRLPDGSLGAWRTVSYAQALAHARSIAQALLQRPLSAERPVAILSDNTIEHGLLALGCMLAGVPYCPISPAYALLDADFTKLRHVLATLTPALLFAQDARFAAACAHTQHHHPDCEVLIGAEALQPLLHTPVTAQVDAAYARTTAETIVKFLFTSGSTKAPKAVINTHRMWCANQAQIAQTLPGLFTEPPVLVDWLPWNHTFGGNKNFGITLYHGGTLYIDEGRPTQGGISETLRNLREISPTVYFNVPMGFDFISKALEGDAALRRSLLQRVKLFFYAGASLSQAIWDRLHRAQEAECGQRIVMGTGLGMTESSPSALFTTSATVGSGDLGLPVPGMVIKLVPVDGKLEVRYRGPNMTPGYWRNPEATREVLDEEGFFCSGDAVRWRQPHDIQQGLAFDGRIAEDFKLATGTFVSVGPLRARAIQAGAPSIQDVVITGLDQHEVGALIFGAPACVQLSGLPTDAPWEAVMHSPPVQAHLQRTLDALQHGATGSASRIARAIAATEPPSLPLGEITDKGSINQRAVLHHRAAWVAALHAGTAPHLLLPRTAPAPATAPTASPVASPTASPSTSAPATLAAPPVIS